VSVELAAAYVSLVPSAAGIEQSIAKELGGSGILTVAKKAGADASKGWASGFSTVGGGLTKSLTPIAGGLTLAFHQSFEAFDQGADALVAKSGLAGKGLEDLVGSMKHLGGEVPQSLGVVGQALGDVYSRTHLTGPALETLTKKFLDLSRITGTDVSTNVANLTRLFGDWGIASDQQANALDTVFGATQKTGIGVDRLSGLVVQFGAPLRQLGFGFEQSIALLGKFENEGVNVETVMGGLRMGLARMSKGSEEAQKNVETLTDAFHSARDKVQGFQADLIAAQKELTKAFDAAERRRPRVGAASDPAGAVRPGGRRQRGDRRAEGARRRTP
jgi:phage-related minor tail protein